MTSDEELAALRAENARLKDNVYDKVVELCDHVGRERDHLRAHVAALVQAATDACRDPMFTARYGSALTSLLDAPDLAALVAREQARDAVIAALRDLARYDDFSAQGCEHCAPDDPHDFDRARVRLGEELRALDAAEKGSTHE